MKARQLIGGAAYPPDTLKIIFEAFDDAWAEVAPSVDTDPTDVESGRLYLADIVLTLTKVGPIERGSLRDAAVKTFRHKLDLL